MLLLSLPAKSDVAASGVLVSMQAVSQSHRRSGRIRPLVASGIGRAWSILTNTQASSTFPKALLRTAAFEIVLA